MDDEFDIDDYVWWLFGGLVSYIGNPAGIRKCMMRPMSK